jgi:predicted RNase H-like HicB family nuclease
MKYVGFKEYVREILKTAEYKKDSEIGCVVAIAPVLPGCMTQGEARDNLIDAIELWITVGLRDGEEMPLINGAKLVTAAERIEKSESALYRV